MHNQLLIKEEEYKGCNIKLYYDESPESPREWDNLGTMVCFHPRSILGDKTDFKSVEDFLQFIKENKKQIVLLNIFAYEHGNICLSTSSFNDMWDSGQIGWIYITKEKIRKEFNKKLISKKLLKSVIKQLELEVETYSQYLSGEIYRFEANDFSGELIDSCGGYYEEDYMLKEVKSQIDYHLNYVSEKQQPAFMGM